MWSLPVALLVAGGWALFWFGGGNYGGLDKDFRAWSFWIGFAIALWLSIGAWFLHEGRELLKDAPPAISSWWAASYASYAVWAFAIGYFLISMPIRSSAVGTIEHGWDFKVRLNVAIIIALIAASPVVVLVWLIAGELRLRDGDCDLATLKRLKRYLTRTFVGLAVILSAAVVSVAWLQILLNAYYRSHYNGHGQTLFIKERYVIQVGIALTGLFAAVYIPVLLTWQIRARDLVDKVYPYPYQASPSDDYPSKGYMDGRQRLTQLLELDLGLAKRLSSALIVLAPLVISLLAYFIPHKS